MMAERADLDAIEARLAMATPGPWIAWHRHVHANVDDDEMSGMGWEIEGPPQPMRGQFARAADAHLIAHSPTDLRTCVEELRLLRAVAVAAQTYRAILIETRQIDPEQCRVLAWANVCRALNALDGGDDAARE